MPDPTSESNECPICKRVFKRSEHLTRHFRTHTQERPFRCPLCEKSFNRQDTLKRHLLGHADETHPISTGGNSQVDQNEWIWLDESQNQRHEAVDLTTADTANLDWYESLVATTQPVCDGSQFPESTSHEVLENRTHDNTLMPLSRTESNVVARSGSFDLTGSGINFAPNSRRESRDYGLSDRSQDLKLPPELFNSMIDDCARKWLRDIASQK